MRKSPVAVVVLLVLAALGLAACGGSSSDSTSTATTAKKESAPAPVSEVKIEAAASGLAFASKTASTTAGELVVDFYNPQSTPHNVALEDASGKVIEEGQTVSGQSTTTSGLEIKPGKYTFFCTIPGHREAGMEGTLTVK